ncbi:MAG: penicillin-insensitive murein endopeptidase [Sandaracinaceae bacterium]
MRPAAQRGPNAVPIGLAALIPLVLSSAALAQPRAERDALPVDTTRSELVGPGSRSSAASPAPAAEAAVEASPSRSVGVPDRGSLRDGVELGEDAALFVRQGPREARWGTAELVGLILRAATTVTTVAPGPKLVVGDLSGPRGGRISPHRSHRTGRDADIGFFLLDADGHAVQAPHFVSLRRDGCGHIRDTRYCFDPARNVALLSAMVQDPVAQVQYVLVAPDIRNRVLAEAERQGIPTELLERIRTVTEPHAGSASHRSHFHVRIYCPEDDRPGCIDEPPYHDWYRGTPAPPTPGVRRMRTAQRRAARRQAARAARRRAAARSRARARQRRARRRSRGTREATTPATESQGG